MVCFVPSACLSIRKSCQRHDCSELGIVRNWVEHCILFFLFSRGKKTRVVCSSVIVSFRRKWEYVKVKVSHSLLTVGIMRRGGGCRSPQHMKYGLVLFHSLSYPSLIRKRVPISCWFDRVFQSSNGEPGFKLTTFRRVFAPI